MEERRARRAARELLPDVEGSAVAVAHGSEHDVVIVAEIGVVRVSKQAGTAGLARRRTELLRRLGQAHLPFAIPLPLSEVTEFDGYAAVALSWVGGAPHAKDSASPEALARLLAALRGVDLAPLAELLEPPHGFAGGDRWGELMYQAVAQLPADLRSEARTRVDDALALSPVPPSLVHGDLAGSNVRWDAGGALVGVIDWDWASAWDPAVDAACLAWHDSDAVRAAVDAETYRRAQIWQRTFGIEHLVAADIRGPGDPGLRERAADWIRRTTSTGGV